MKNIINIGIPSKGRLRKDVLNIFKNKRLNLISERGKRDLIGSIKNIKNVKILYLHEKKLGRWGRLTRPSLSLVVFLNNKIALSTYTKHID